MTPERHIMEKTIERCAALVESKADAWDKAGEMIPQGSDPKEGVGRVTHFQIADALRAAAFDLQSLKLEP